MRCERCGREITNGTFRMGGVTLCERCAMSMRLYNSPSDFLNDPFVELDAIAATLRNMEKNQIEFGNSSLTCPKCGMTLREFDTNGRVGCIECYNVFNENIVREMFKQQGNSEYYGRFPGQPADTKVRSDEIKKPEPASPKTEENVPSDVKEPEAPKAQPATKKGLTIDKLMKADLGMLSDEDIQEGIKLAAEAEEYILASKLRDELKGRKDGTDNG